VTRRTIFSKFKGTINEKAFLEGLEFDIFIQHEVNHFSIAWPPFEKYRKVDETYRKVRKISIPDKKMMG